MSLLTLNVTAWPLSPAGPAEIAVAQPATVCGPLSTCTSWFGPAAKLGASFTSDTAIVNVRARARVAAAVGVAAVVHRL